MREIWIAIFISWERKSWQLFKVLIRIGYYKNIETDFSFNVHYFFEVMSIILKLFQFSYHKILKSEINFFYYLQLYLRNLAHNATFLFTVRKSSNLLKWLAMLNSGKCVKWVNDSHTFISCMAYKMKIIIMKLFRRFSSKHVVFLFCIFPFYFSGRKNQCIIDSGSAILQFELY